MANHNFNITLAKRYGIEEAILIEHIYWWIHKNECEEVEDMVHDGAVWCRSTARGFAKYIPYMKPDKIWRILKKLEGRVLRVGNYNRQALNQTLWYTFTDDFVKELIGLDYDFEKIKNAILKNEKSNNSIINNPIKEDNIIEDKENKLSNDNSKSAYSDDFLKFWEAYGLCRDKGTTYKRWKNLSKKDKEAALKALPDYFSDCKRCDRKKRYPAVYLSKRTWEDDFSNQEKEEEKEELPAGLTPETWALRQGWMYKFIPRIAERITPDMFLTLQGLSHFKPDVFKDIIEDIDKSDFNGDIVTEFDRLRFTENYASRIDL